MGDTNTNGATTYCRIRIENAFARAKERGEANFITFVTAGYPSPQDTPSILLAMQDGGASIIE